MTHNNYQPEDLDSIRRFMRQCKYFVYGKEDKGTPHLQCYFELPNAKTYSAIHKSLGFKCHFEPRQGTPTQAAGYCKKGDFEPPPDEPFDYSVFYYEPHPTWEGEEYGTISHQGSRTDISAPVDLITKGTPMAEVAEAYPLSFVKYHRGFTALRSVLSKPRKLDAAPEVIVLWGPTGTGKTRDAQIEYWPDVPHYWWKPSNGSWWDGYDGQDKIILDEFRGQMTWSDLLALLDRNECRCPIKGGFVQIQASKVIITSPCPPTEWYKEDDRYDKYAQLQRRITKVVHYNSL